MESTTNGEIMMVEHSSSSSSTTTSADNHHVITIIGSDLAPLVSSMNDDLQRLCASETRVTLPNRLSAPISRIPLNLKGIDFRAESPEIVSIGPYHHGEDKLMEFQDYKRHALLSSIENKEVYLRDYIEAIGGVELEARNFYSETIPMNRFEFIEMLVLDGCFIIQTFGRFWSDDHGLSILNQNNNEYPATPSIFDSIVARDLLKLENQIPFFVLDILFDLSSPKQSPQQHNQLILRLLALKFFNLIFPKPLEILDDNIVPYNQAYHLLDLIYRTLTNFPVNDTASARSLSSSSQSVQCVTQLKLSGLKFRPTKKANLLQVHFKHIRGILDIPQITINDFITTVLINCVALEQCLISQEHFERSQYVFFIPYVAFMSCLINSTRDVAHLSADGIITNFSEGDRYVTRLFNDLGKSVNFNFGMCYLTRECAQLEAYYDGFWATTIRTYFRSPWALISVCSASLLLVLTVLQTLVALMSYKKHFN